MRLAKLTKIAALSLAVVAAVPLVGCAAPAGSDERVAATTQAESAGGIGIGLSGPKQIFDILKTFQTYQRYGKFEITTGELLDKLEASQQTLDELQTQMDALQKSVTDAHKDVLNVATLDKVNGIRALFEQYRTVAAKNDPALVASFLKDLREGRATGGTLRWADLASLHDILVGQSGSASLLVLTAKVQAAKGIAGSADDGLGKYFASMQLIQQEGFFLLSEADAQNPAVDLAAMRATQRARVDDQTQVLVDANNEYGAAVIALETSTRTAQVGQCVCTDDRPALCLSGGGILPDTSWSFDDSGAWPNPGGGGKLVSGCNAARDEYIQEKAQWMQPGLNKTLWDSATSFRAWMDLRAASEDVITVIGAYYGVPNNANDATPQLAAACEGLTSCSYKVDVSKLGDPAYGIAKRFGVTYRCDGGDVFAPDPKRIEIAAEANGTTVTLSCPKLAGDVQRLVGTYKDPSRPNDPSATVTISVVTRAMVMWKEGGEWGMSWSLALTPDASKLDVSPQSTYSQNFGYKLADVQTDASGKVTGIVGPWNKVYTRVD